MTHKYSDDLKSELNKTEVDEKGNIDMRGLTNDPDEIMDLLNEPDYDYGEDSVPEFEKPAEKEMWWERNNRIGKIADEWYKNQTALNKVNKRNYTREREVHEKEQERLKDYFA